MKIRKVKKALRKAGVIVESTPLRLLKKTVTNMHSNERKLRKGVNTGHTFLNNMFKNDLKRMSKEINSKIKNIKKYA